MSSLAACCMIVFVCISQQASHRSLTAVMPRLHLTGCRVGLRCFAASFIATLRSVNAACRLTQPSVDHSSQSVTCDSSQPPIVLYVLHGQFRPSVRCLAAQRRTILSRPHLNFGIKICPRKALYKPQQAMPLKCCPWIAQWRPQQAAP